MAEHGLAELAMRVLAQRGAPPTPANLQAIKNALEANPQLLDNVQGLLRQQAQTQTREGDVSTPAPVVFRDQFDEALERAVNGGQPPQPEAGQTSQAAQGSPAEVTHAAPPIVPVDKLALEETSPQAPTAAPVDIQGAAALPGQVGQLPSDFDAVAQDAAEREFGIIPPILIPAPAGRQTGTDLVSTGGTTARPGAQGALPGPQRALLEQQRALSAPQQALTGPQKQLTEPSKQLTGPPKQLTGPQKALPAPDVDILQAHAEAIGRGELQAGQHTQDVSKARADLEGIGKLNPSGTDFIGQPERIPQVEADINRTIDAQDGPLKESVRAGRPAVEFELDGERFFVNEAGVIGNETTLTIVREQSVLDRIRAFLLEHKSRFATLARIL